MSLPASEPVPNDVPQSPPARRRRGRHLVIPADANERAIFMEKLARRTLPSFDFFLFSLLAGAILAAGILLDSPTLFFLAALAAPLMTPLIGLALCGVIGSGKCFLRDLAGIIVGSLLVCITGVLAGLAAYLLPELPLGQVSKHAQLTWIDFLVLTLGVILAAFIMARSEQKPLLPSAILAYELYIPAGLAGFGLSTRLTGGATDLWPSALVTFALYLVWVVFLGIIAFWILGIRPLNRFGYGFGALLILISLLVGLSASGLGSNTNIEENNPLPTDISPAIHSSTLTRTPTTAFKSNTVAPEPTLELTPLISSTPTRTLVPSSTPTETLTPAPTPLWAVVRASNGAFVRAEPSFTGKVVAGVMGGGLVQVLPETAQGGGTTWVHIITNSGIEGWIVQSVLETATPVPTW